MKEDALFQVHRENKLLYTKMVFEVCQTLIDSIWGGQRGRYTNRSPLILR